MSAIHCINPNCSLPYPQPRHNKFCQRCGTQLHLNQRYIALNRLGSGGFATIYVVWDEQKKKEKVLKVLTITKDKAIQLFDQEAKVLQSLDHPGVPKVGKQSLFTTKTPKGKLHCLVMEYIKGHTLEELLENQYPQGCPEVLVYDWLKQITNILAVLHKQHIIHRDIKPSNIMFRSSTGRWGGGKVVLIDFGGAKQIKTQSSITRLFSSGYSPPEQMSGEGVAPNADIFALGRTMIHLLTAQHPMELEDLHSGQLFWRQYVQITPAFADLLDMMTHPQPDNRPQSAQELKRLLGKLSGIRPPKPSPTPQGLKVRWQRFKEQVQQGRKTASAGLVRLRKAVWLGIRQFGWATLATVRETIFGGVGAMMGSGVGVVLVSHSPLGEDFAGFLNQVLFAKPLGGMVSSELLGLAVAGLGTGLGLAMAGSYGQRNYPLWPGVVGFFSYAIAGLLWLGLPIPLEFRLGFMLAIAIFLVTWSLGFSAYLWLHSLIAILGTGFTLTHLLHWTGISPPFLQNKILSFTNLNLTMGFFTVTGLMMGFYLGLSYYLFQPLLRWLERYR
ncbi:serine/threonine-protein kinase [Spirulina sp. CS-785/01]|uniref:serine/threonine protein kinase n=1 Tax=Spirulina sp. CS-785/01 TaxID=3021716 RepID=UPI00232FA7C7|nr:serine/threonine-protein kinase [Spirulina sp. CS-785/01]MDB9315546.1 serine/threonine-protein kinase [Spirulina sp. CS-785/01]